jgi:Zn-dependent protease with chaperone function
MRETTQTEFEMLAHRAEAFALAHPRRYKLRILLYALLGYLFIVFMLFLLLGLAGGIIGSAFISTALFIILLKTKLIFVILPLAWVLIKALWVRVEPPRGYKLDIKNFPSLNREIETLRDQLKAVKVHQVLLTPEFNAAVVQTPRLGIFGWHKNTLILGLELLLSLSPEQARAVLAHEFGHLSGNHSRFNGWVYRVRATWEHILHAYQGSNSFGGRLMQRFFNWYSPRFSAYSFALARANEYQADAIAAALTSPQTVAEALVNTHVTSSYAEQDYWAQYFKKADDLPEPDLPPWAGLSRFINQSRISQEQYATRLNRVMQQETAYHDTHPALKDRIAALKVEPAPPDAVQETAAEQWLDDQLSRVLDDFDREWLQHNRETWRSRYEYVRDARKTLADLAGKQPADLTDDDLWLKATLTEEFADENEALALYRLMQTRHPEHPKVAFAVGRLLYNHQNEACLEQLKTALNDPQLALDACRYAYAFLENRDRLEEARWWENTFNEQNRILEESEQERNRLQPGDPLEKADIPAELLQHIVTTLKAHPKVKRAWLAGKRLKHFPEYPALAFVIQLKGFVTNEQKIIEQVIAALNLDCTHYAIPNNGDFKKLAKQIIKAGDRIV